MTLITKCDFATLMNNIYPQGDLSRVAVACSGGPDSMALTLLMRDWAASLGHRMVALIVDHRLRDESTAEAELVQRRLAAAGVEAEILSRTSEGEITSDIQNQARNIRYQLLQSWCVENNFKTLALAHHREDQAETFLLRLSRGSGVDGLSAMDSLSQFGEIETLRPLLDTCKTDIIATLKDFGVDAVIDPSNVNEKFDRVKIRQRQTLFEEVGLSTKRLANTAKSMRRARVALEQITSDLLATSAKLYPEGYCMLDAKLILRAPDEIGLRALSSILSAIGGRDYPARLDQVERLHSNLLQDRLGGGCTLAGCGVAPKGQEIIIFRENSAISDVKLSAKKLIWDGRYMLNFMNVKRGVEVKALGGAGWKNIKQTIENKCNYPAVVRNSLPALWQGDNLLSVPHIQGMAHAQKHGLKDISFLPLKNFGSSPFILKDASPI